MRATLARIGQDVPLRTVELPTGTQVFDWTLPREWNVREAGGAPDGTRVVDVADSSLHLLGYSVPVDTTLDLAALRAPPHRPSRSRRRAVPHVVLGGALGVLYDPTRRRGAARREYHVRIDATLEDGHVTYGEVAVEGESEDVVLLTTTVCHPALANDNLSGIVLLAGLARILGAQDLRHSFRLVWSPGTIGPLCWLHTNPSLVSRVRHGFAVSCVGDAGPLTYKRSRRENTAVDSLAAGLVLRGRPGATVRPWAPYGGDERQFSPPGFDVPFGALSRTPADAFPEYHSSADGLDLVRPEALGDSLYAALEIVDALERNEVFVNTSPYGEPQLGRRGLYRSLAGGSSEEGALLWVLSLADGRTSLLEIADRSGLDVAVISGAAMRLEARDLLKRAT